MKLPPGCLEDAIMFLPQLVGASFLFSVCLGCLGLQGWSLAPTLSGGPLLARFIFYPAGNYFMFCSDCCLSKFVRLKVDLA